MIGHVKSCPGLARFPHPAGPAIGGVLSCRVRVRSSSRPRGGAVKVRGALTVPDTYGYVLASVATAAIVNQYLAVRVAVARRKYQVKYPAMYAQGDSEEAHLFNCIQRAHQNMLEYLPNALACQMVMGLKYPVVAAAMGGVWAISRLIYAAGYSTGDPSKRAPGNAIAGVLYLGLIAGTIVASVRMIMG